MSESDLLEDIQENDPIPEDKEKENVRIIKPHEKAAPDFSHLVLQHQEETVDQAPLVVLVQGSKNVLKNIIFIFKKRGR